MRGTPAAGLAVALHRRDDTKPYFERSGLDAFYPSVSVVFTFEGGHLHVPLLLSAYGYTTYKGI
ncbi:MAG: hydroxyisourate hydrolase [Chloroflexi bacterium]|nr:MAG: hydroxyisourate hydrolase [Chloroflexota bacterium]